MALSTPISTMFQALRSSCSASRLFLLGSRSRRTMRPSNMRTSNRHARSVPYTCFDANKSEYVDQIDSRRVAHFSFAKRRIASASFVSNPCSWVRRANYS